MPCCHDVLETIRAAPVLHPVGRRSFVKLAAVATGVGLFASWAPRLAFAGEAQALMLSCMDYRVVDPMVNFMSAKGLDGQYDHVVLAGASLGVVSKRFAGWHETFWEHLDVAIKLHHVHEVIVIDHRDCGAYKLAFGEDKVSTPEGETEAHTKTMQSFGKLVRKHHPDLTSIEAYLMALDGTAEKIDV